MMFTILGGSGFIGGALVRALRDQGHEVQAPPRGAPDLLERDLGEVIYCVGLTADFRGRPFDTVDAHVVLLRQLLQAGRFRSLLYLSSTRVYGQAAHGSEEQRLSVDPSNPDELYNLSKLMGESLCLASGRDGVRVARLSNVYGADFASSNFLAVILRQALVDAAVRLRTARDSAKDYVSIDDVVALLPRIALGGKERLYNVASGRNVSNGELLDGLSRLASFTVEVDAKAPAPTFPRISIDRAGGEFGYAPRSILADLPGLVGAFRKAERVK